MVFEIVLKWLTALAGFFVLPMQQSREFEAIQSLHGPDTLKGGCKPIEACDLQSTVPCLQCAKACRLQICITYRSSF